MTTYGDIIQGAYRLSGVLGQGQSTMNAYQAQTGLFALREMLDGWNADNLNLYTIQQLIIPMVGMKQIYTIGPGGDFDIPNRPPALEAAWFRQITTPPYNDLPITLLSALDWGNIRSKGITGNISTYAYFDQNYPLGNIELWPIPNGSELYIQCYLQLNSAVTLTTQANLPPGYQGAIRFNLARLLAAENGMEPLTTVIQQAVQYKRLLEENNGQELQRLSFDPMCMGSSMGRYMISSDQPRMS